MNCRHSYFYIQNTQRHTQCTHASHWGLLHCPRRVKNTFVLADVLVRVLWSTPGRRWRSSPWRKSEYPTVSQLHDCWWFFLPVKNRLLRWAGHIRKEIYKIGIDLYSKTPQYFQVNWIRHSQLSITLARAAPCSVWCNHRPLECSMMQLFEKWPCPTGTLITRP